MRQLLQNDMTSVKRCPTQVNDFLKRDLRTLSSPYSIQKRPEPRICPKFVPTIGFSGFQSGGPIFVKNLSKI